MKNDVRSGAKSGGRSDGPGKYGILIIEDDPGVAKGLQFGLQQEGYGVFWGATCAQGMDLLEREQPHLLILDIRLPDGNGFDLCRRVRSDGYKLPIIMLTARDEDADKVLGLELGADDYVVKPFGLRELVSRIRSLLRRSYGDLSRTDDNGSVRFGDITVDLNRLRVYRGDVEIFLTPTEMKMLKCLLDRPDRPVSRRVLIEEVWGYSDFFGDERTIDVHIRHLREKLEEDPASPVWITTVRGFGYRFNP